GYDAAYPELGTSRASLLRTLKEVSVTDKRTNRAADGRCALIRDEAAVTAATQREATQTSSRRFYSIAAAVDRLGVDRCIAAGS
ncbi:integrase, partial [Escherichia coli]|nr:integrase [Escherichia coli]